MKYTVYLDKKQVVYSEDLPAGHLIALKKIFEPQGYEFSTELESLDARSQQLNGLMDQLRTPSMSASYSPTSMWAGQSFKIDGQGITFVMPHNTKEQE